MQDQQLLERITLNPKVMVGKPVIQGTREQLADRFVVVTETRVRFARS